MWEPISLQKAVVDELQLIEQLVSTLRDVGDGKARESAEHVNSAIAKLVGKLQPSMRGIMSGQSRGRVCEI